MSVDHIINTKNPIYPLDEKAGATMPGDEGVEEDLVKAVVDRVVKINEEQLKSMMDTMNANMMAQFKSMMSITSNNQMASVVEPTVEKDDGHNATQALNDEVSVQQTPVETVTINHTPNTNTSQSNSEFRVLVKPQEPPSFASCTKPYMVWRREVMTWKKMMEIQKVDSRQLAYKIISSMDVGGNVQGSKLKLTVMRKMDKEMLTEESFEKLIKILDEENLGEAVKKKLTLWWRLFEMRRDPFQDYKQFLNDFDTAATELEGAEVQIDPVIKAGLLLKAILLPEQEEKIVLSAINQKADNIYKEVRNSIENVILNQLSSGNNASRQNAVNAMFAKKDEMAFREEVWKQAHILAAQSTGWDLKKGKSNNKRKVDGGKVKNRKDRETGLPMKCFNCACQCSGDCEHECTYHLIEGCPKPKKRKKDESIKEKESIVQSNLFFQADQDTIPLWFAHNIWVICRDSCN